MKKPRVVIIGGGFGGVYTARNLRRYADRGDIDLTLISRSDYFLFTPLLHEVATGGVGPTSSAEPIREMFRKEKVKIIQSIVESIDLETKTVKTTSCDVVYDYLVFAGGATTNFYNIPGAEEYSHTLKNLEDAMNIRTSIIDSFEAALAARAHRDHHKGEPDYSKEQLSFVVVGGGPTGVELAAELAEFVHGTIKAYYEKSGIDWSQVSISLLAASADLLTQCHPEMRKNSHLALERLGVKVVCGAQVTKVTDRSVLLADGRTFPTAHVFWVAGVKPSLPLFTFSSTPAYTQGKHVITDRSGRVVLDKYLHLTDSTGIGRGVFVLGDAGGTAPMVAQAAEYAAVVVAKNIMRSIRNSSHGGVGSTQPLVEFIYKTKGTLVSLGQWNATGDVFGVRISGPFAWFVWRMTYLFKFITWRKRLKVAVEWTINLFSPRDVTKVR